MSRRPRLRLRAFLLVVALVSLGIYAWSSHRWRAEWYLWQGDNARARAEADAGLPSPGCARILVRLASAEVAATLAAGDSDHRGLRALQELHALGAARSLCSALADFIGHPGGGVSSPRMAELAAPAGGEDDERLLTILLERLAAQATAGTRSSFLAGPLCRAVARVGGERGLARLEELSCASSANLDLEWKLAAARVLASAWVSPQTAANLIRTAHAQVVETFLQHAGNRACAALPALRARLEADPAMLTPAMLGAMARMPGCAPGLGALLRQLPAPPSPEIDLWVACWCADGSFCTAEIARHLSDDDSGELFAVDAAVLELCLPRADPELRQHVHDGLLSSSRWVVGRSLWIVQLLADRDWESEAEVLEELTRRNDTHLSTIVPRLALEAAHGGSEEQWLELAMSINGMPPYALFDEWAKMVEFQGLRPTQEQLAGELAGSGYGPRKRLLDAGLWRHLGAWSRLRPHVLANLTSIVHESRRVDLLRQLVEGVAEPEHEPWTTALFTAIEPVLEREAWYLIAERWPHSPALRARLERALTSDDPREAGEAAWLLSLTGAPPAVWALPLVRAVRATPLDMHEVPGLSRVALARGR